MSDAFVGIVVLVAPVRQTTTADVDRRILRRVPENTLTRQTRPRNGSTVVLTTSAANGPSGSQLSGFRDDPSSFMAGGAGRAGGDGRASTSSDISSCNPRPVSAEVGMTGKKRPRETAVSKS